MLSRKQGNLLFLILVAAAMSAALSLVVTISNTGVRGDLSGRWLKAWALSFLIALPTALLLIPPIRRLVDRTLKSPPSPKP